MQRILAYANVLMFFFLLSLCVFEYFGYQELRNKLGIVEFEKYLQHYPYIEDRRTRYHD